MEVKNGNPRWFEINGSMKLGYPAKYFFGWIEVVAAVVQYLIDLQATKAWESRLANAQQEIIHELENRFNDAVSRGRIGTAFSRFETASRLVEYYRNEPENRLSSLQDAEKYSLDAIFELEQLGLYALHSWLIASLLHMTILQEWLLIYESAGAQKNINVHYDYMTGVFPPAQSEFLRTFHYIVHVHDGVRYYIYIGPEPHFPSTFEDDVCSAVATTDGKLEELKSLVVRSVSERKP